MENKTPEETSSTPVLSGGPSAEPKKPLKLNYKRTFTIGFAFFGILLLWQIYNLTCPTFLTELFDRALYPNVDFNTLKTTDPDLYRSYVLNVQYIVGIIMAMDNIAALIMLPIFGRISDKTKSPLGKRMPFILIGTLISAIIVPFIPVAFYYGSIPGMIVTLLLVIFFMMMYRSPAVALMPDMTPKPLRAKANGIINIAGYLGGGIGTVMLLITPFQLTTYLNGERDLWRLEIPYLVVSLMMIVSVLVLFLKIKENKIEQEVEPEMKRGEMEAEIVDKLTDVSDEAPMSKANKRMLFFILAAEVLWFMSFNSVETYIGNYVIYFLDCKSGSTSLLSIIAGVCSVVG